MTDARHDATRADLIVRGGRVFASGDPRRPLPLGCEEGPLPDGAPTAVAIRGGRIASVGSDREIEAWRGPRTEVVDARDGLIIPGFDDAHLHIRMGSIALDRVDLFGLTSLDGVQAAIARYADERRDAPWVIGRGWLYAAFPGGLPTREQLDAVVPDRPAYFECFDGHSGWANTPALDLAGIGDETPDPRDGRIVRDADGRATGALKERATELVEVHLPQLTDDGLVRLFGAGLEALARAGITSAQDAWGRVEDIAILDRILERDGRLPVRCRIALEIVPGETEPAFRERLDRFEDAVRGRSDHPWLRGGILKSFMDGVVEARTAYLLEPFPGTDTRGDRRWADEEIAWAVREAHGRGWQVKLHAIGTAAVRQALDAYQALGPGASAERRHRIEHIETLDPTDLPRFAELGIVASMQPLHAVPDFEQMGVWSGNLATDIAATGWRLRSILDSGAPVAMGSDWPVVPFDPLLEIHAAVNRQTVDHRPEGGWLPAECLDLPRALAAATFGSAYAEHAEQERGELSPGRLADLVVLDRDLLADGPGSILGTKVVLTVIDGATAHRCD